MAFASSDPKEYNQSNVTQNMRTLLFLVTALVFAASPAAIALSSEQHITPEYVRSHSNEFSVKVAKEKNGLIAFTVVVTLREPRFVVAHLVVRRGDRVLAQSETPAFTKNAENTFSFSLPPQCLDSSEFTLGTSSFSDSGGVAVPVPASAPAPGTIGYRFRLRDFVAPERLKASKTKVPAAELERELQEITAERNRAIAAATESINAKHLASLQARLRRATKTRDPKSEAQLAEAIGRITVIGTWSAVSDSGYRTDITIRPDGSFFGTNENANGRWDIRGGKLIISNPTNQDIYELPTNDKMTGVNTQGPKITASRISK